VLTIVRPIVECNRIRIDNGRRCLREIVFGEAEEPHHRDAIAITQRTEAAIAEVLKRDQGVSDSDAATLAHIGSVVMFLGMAASTNIAHTVDEIIDEIGGQLVVLLH